MTAWTRAERAAVARAKDREVSVAAGVVAAWSEEAAAHRLGLSHSTVKHHPAEARSKVGATTTAQLVSILSPRLSDFDEMARSTDEESQPAVRTLGA